MVDPEQADNGGFHCTECGSWHPDENTAEVCCKL